MGNKSYVSVFALLLAMLIILSGCGAERVALPQDDPSSVSTSAIPPTKPTVEPTPPWGDPATPSNIPMLEDVENLPEELFIARTGDVVWSAVYKTYSFLVEFETVLTVTTDLAPGELSLSLMSFDTSKYIIEERDFQAETVSVTLEPGVYQLVLIGQIKDGSLHIIGLEIQ